MSDQSFQELGPQDPDRRRSAERIEKRKTYIAGFDWITQGGLPRGTSTLLSGSPGSGKTVFCLNFVAAGIQQADETAVFVTFEESPNRLRQYFAGFDWEVDQWEADQKIVFLDFSPDANQAPTTIVGEYDFGGLVTRIESAVKQVGAKRLIIDSLSALLRTFGEPAIVRHELFRLIEALRAMGVTAVITDEQATGFGNDHNGVHTQDFYGVKDFVVDNLVVARNRLAGERRRRTIEVLKFRGTPHQKGEFPFTISQRDGLVIIPLSELELKQQSSTQRVTSGVPAFDELCGGGFFDGSVVLVTGATGCGKTLMTTQFAAGGVAENRRCLLLGFEESRHQLMRNAESWGTDFQGMEDSGLLRLACCYPEANGLEDHLIRIKHLVEEFEPDRVVIDSLSALERISSSKMFREFVVALTGFLKGREVTALMTLTTESLMGGQSVTEGHISSIADSIILLRYVEAQGSVRRAITVLKMRGSWHDKKIRRFTINSQGMRIGQPFHNITGILSGGGQRRVDGDGVDVDDTRITEDGV